MATFQMNYLSMKIGMQTNITAILPSYKPQYGDTPSIYKNIYPRDRKFKVLWLLHTDSGDDAELLKYTGILRYAEKTNLAVIMPCGYNAMYSDDPKGQKFFELITHEQRVICQNYFPISSKREDNYIGGISLGAYGALKAAVTYPDYYSSAIIIDGGFGPDMQNGFLANLRSDAISKGTIPPIPQDDAPAETIELYDTAGKASEKGSLPRLFWAWGRDNHVTKKDSSEGAQELKKLGYEVYAKEYEGCGRSWDFWDLALRDAIENWLPV